MASAKKPSLADVAVLASEPDADDTMANDDYSTAIDELADTLGVAPEKRDVFAAAFQAACMSCA